MKKSFLLGAGFFISLSLVLPAQAKVYKWVDDQGITHYGEVIPTEYANKERSTITKSGLVEKAPEKMTPEAMRAKQEAEKKKKIEKQAEVEQQRRDSAMLNTYSNEKEIDQALERSLVLVNARVESNRMLLQSSQDTLDGLKSEADARTQAGKKIPQSLTNDIAQTEARVARYAAELSKSEEELISVKARFDREKELYRKLKTETPAH